VAAELGRLEEARRIVGEALASTPDDPALLERMADLAYRLGRTDEALRAAGSAIAADPNRYDAHLTAA
jgi:tetratricopeptide (TPR) repeat protein